MLKEIKQVIKEAEQSAKKCPKMDLIHDTFSASIINLFYGNLISNFKGNLTPENLEKFNISKEEEKNIKKNFGRLFKRTEIALKKTKGINEKDYNLFKGELEKMSKGGYNLLLEIEKSVDFNSCKREIDKFKEEIKKLGRKFGVKQFEDEETGKVGVSIGFEEENGN